MNIDLNLLGLDRETLEQYFEVQGEKKFRASQVMQWVHQYGVTSYDAMTNLSKPLRQKLQNGTNLLVPEIVSEQLSQDGTRKWLLRMAEGNAIETVFIPESNRGTLCVSSQVGCALKCSFCATGQQGFNRNLTVSEIIGQVWLAARHLGQRSQAERIISNVVLMGMGEPLMNLENVVSAISIMLDDFAYGLSKRRVTLSTAGIIPGILQLLETCPVSLAVSLHSTDNDLRDELVPINKTYPIADLLDTCKHYAQHSSSRITFEYIMLDGINDSLACAKDLVKLLNGIPAKVNLIPFNVIPHVAYRRSSDEAVQRFRDYLLASGLTTITRKTRGHDIAAACGQLAGDIQARSLVRRKYREQLAQASL